MYFCFYLQFYIQIYLLFQLIFTCVYLIISVVIFIRKIDFIFIFANINFYVLCNDLVVYIQIY